MCGCSAVDASEPHRVVGTLSGLLPGAKETVPWAEAYAMKVLLKLTQGPLTFCSYLHACVKRIRKLRPQSQFVVGKRSNSHLWLQLKQLVQDREFRIFRLLSHQARDALSSLKPTGLLTPLRATLLRIGLGWLFWTSDGAFKTGCIADVGRSRRPSFPGLGFGTPTRAELVMHYGCFLHPSQLQPE